MCVCVCVCVACMVCVYVRVCQNEDGVVNFHSALGVRKQQSVEETTNLCGVLI